MAGFSHMSRRLDQLMNSYFSADRCLDLVLHCEEQGIDTWQTTPGNKFRTVMRAVRERGSRMQFILLSTDTAFTGYQDRADPKPIAIVHQGVMVRPDDAGRAAGEDSRLRKRIHDAGYLAGISTHDPNHLPRIGDFGWRTIST